MQVPVLDMSGKQVKTIDLPADIFEAKINNGLMHQAYVRQMANARLGTHKVQRRGEVKLTTAKMYKQKGTGRARHGAHSATQFVGGGRPMGPQPRDYTQDMPKKMRRAAIRSCLSALLATMVNWCSSIASRWIRPRPKTMKRILQALAGENSTLVLIAETQRQRAAQRQQPGGRQDAARELPEYP